MSSSVYNKHHMKLVNLLCSLVKLNHVAAVLIFWYKLIQQGSKYLDSSLFTSIIGLFGIPGTLLVNIDWQRTKDSKDIDLWTYNLR